MGVEREAVKGQFVFSISGYKIAHLMSPNKDETCVYDY